MNGPLVSIIIPCFNQGQYLAEAIDSALVQAYRHFEIIVIDSGSTDQTPAVVHRYSDRIRSLSIENLGVSRARNAGISTSRGELIALLDADDRWLPDKLAHQVPRLLGSPDVAMLFSSYRSFWPEEKTTTTFVVDGWRPTLHDQLRFNFVNSQSAIFRRSIIEAVGGFDETLERAEDWELWNRIVAMAPIMGTSQVVAEYRRRAGTLSGDARLMLESKVRVLNKSRWLHGRCAACEVAYRAGLREAHAVYAARRCADSKRQLRSGRLIAAFLSRAAGLWHNPRSPLQRAGRKPQTT